VGFSAIHMALKDVVPSSYGNPFLRFYSPSIDSPLIPEWNDLSISKTGGRSPVSRWGEELQQNFSKKNVESSITRAVNKSFATELEQQTIEEALQQMERKEDPEDLEVQMDFGMDKYESSPYAEQILAFLNPFFKELKEEGFFSKTLEPRENILQYIIDRFKRYSNVNTTQTQELKEVMNVKKLLIPYLELDLPPSLILKYNELEDDDPVLLMYQFNPIIGERIRELGALLDKYDTTKEVLCILVWSLHDNSLVCLPSVGLVPYPLCWTCNKSFGMQACSICGVAKYCSKACQQSDWKGVHRTLCVEMSAFAEKHRLLEL